MRRCSWRSGSTGRFGAWGGRGTVKIKRMTASFGGLEGARLELGPGLNVIQGPQRGGKIHLGRAF